jgi:hypothetical protein
MTSQVSSTKDLEELMQRIWAGRAEGPSDANVMAEQQGARRMSDSTKHIVWMMPDGSMVSILRDGTGFEMQLHGHPIGPAGPAQDHGTATQSGTTEAPKGPETEDFQGDQE